MENIKALKKSERRPWYLFVKLSCISGMLFFGVYAVVGLAGGIVGGFLNWKPVYFVYEGGLIAILVLIGNYFQKNIWDAYLCVPRLGQYLSRKEIQQLLEKETFVQVEGFRDVTLQNKVFESEHWIKIKDRYIAKNLVIAFWTGGNGPGPNGYYTPYFMYMTGDSFNVSIVDGEELEWGFLNRSLNVPNFLCIGRDKKIYRKRYEAYILEHPEAAVENKQCIQEPCELRTAIINEILTTPGNWVMNRRYFFPNTKKPKRAHIKMERNQRRRDARRK